MQPARDALVRVVREQFIEDLGENVHDLVAPIEYAQRSPADVLRELDDFLETIAQGQVHEIVGSYEAASGGSGDAIHAIARDVLVPAIDYAEVVAACAIQIASV